MTNENRAYLLLALADVVEQALAIGYNAGGDGKSWTATRSGSLMALDMASRNTETPSWMAQEYAGFVELRARVRELLDVYEQGQALPPNISSAVVFENEHVVVQQKFGA